MGWLHRDVPGSKEFADAGGDITAALYERGPKRTLMGAFAVLVSVLLAAWLWPNMPAWLVVLIVAAGIIAAWLVLIGAICFGCTAEDWSRSRAELERLSNRRRR